MGKVVIVVVIIGALFGMEHLGERRGKKWADDWYAGSPNAEPREPKESLPGPTASISLLRMPKDDTLHERVFHRKHERIMEQHKELLVQAGRITDAEHFVAFEYLGTYGWYNGICDDVGIGHEKPAPCSFGAYTFSPVAFEQAKHLYVLHGQMGEGSDLLVDVGAGAFDKGVIGYNVTYLTYCELTGGKLKHCDWTNGLKDATVIEFVDKNTVRLDKRAQWNAEMYGLVVKPPTYVDMCNCTVPTM